jgi:hypothetical protein
MGSVRMYQEEWYLSVASALRLMLASNRDRLLNVANGQPLRALMSRLLSTVAAIA